MSDESVAAPVEETIVKTKKRKKHARPKQQPRYHVILWDDDDHSYDYVMRMMLEVFAHPLEKGFAIAREVDASGRAICLTTTMEHAELKRDQIHAYGKDDLIARCQGSMSASIEAES
ncbi:ATP-dependent Clp protease adaptor ClpS [Lignipirellula cremea]|uniref:ATP-dependent Clp protease adaptor protein ClpS n=1 Tax=Lignipirellula cremea TaxID=2528010 RepID=A0A518DYP0_9BACT|nr:ATP-dependent Clp protease adaptor ClpS [Lignipirellula cremea]QDU96960.1 ATP-dependent Clp protease adaptor protein ClpS [Lignipirellula cremea]